jgi:hypothetical protein
MNVGGISWCATVDDTPIVMSTNPTARSGPPPFHIAYTSVTANAARKICTRISYRNTLCGGGQPDVRLRV